MEAMIFHPLLAQLTAFAIAAWVLRRAFLRSTNSPTAAGAIVMAIGIYGLVAFRDATSIPAAAAQAFAIGLLVIWSFIAISYAQCWWLGRMTAHTASPSDSFAVGTWVAGTAVMARIVLLGAPHWRGLAVALAIAAFALWLWYLKLVVRGGLVILASRDRLRATGRILLATVSTQSLVLIAWDLFPDSDFLRVPLAGMVWMGFLLYGLGLVIIIQRYWREPHWSLSEDWDNTNCIVHGAMSISGLAVAYTGLLPKIVGIATWLYVLIALVAVEIVEITRAMVRARDHGLCRGIFVYHVSQWSRNFTFGMFCAFTVATAPVLKAQLILSPLFSLVDGLIAYGPYVVLLLLLAECGLWVSANAQTGKISDQRLAQASDEARQPRGGQPG